jgi:hypothetical protein
LTYRVLIRCLAFLLAGAAGAAARTPGGEGLVQPNGGFVLDGGDMEEALADDGSCLDSVNTVTGVCHRGT